MGLQRRMRVVNCDPKLNSGDRSVDPALKVAFATTDMKHVNQHFGSARSFAFFNVSPEQASLLEAAQFGDLSQDGNEDKLAAKISMLEGCAAVYCQAVGSSAVRQLVARGIQPVKVSEGRKIADLVEALQDEMRQGPSAWVAQAISRQDGTDMSRFDEMESEGWDE